jgi:hypothetical protein
MRNYLGNLISRLTRQEGNDTVKFLLNSPSEADGINTFYFGHLPGNPDRIDDCEEMCANEKKCQR